MKNLICVCMLFLVGISPIWADTISTDRSGFDKIYNFVDDAIFDLRYYSPYNFTGSKIRGYKAPVAYMTKEALQALAVAAADLRQQGYRILVWDSYRPQKAVDHFGSTIDLTIVKQDGSFVDMGGTFDLFSPISHPDYKKITKKQKRNRKILRDAMVKAGFKPLDSEWWHFTLKDEPYKDTYFNFDVE